MMIFKKKNIHTLFKLTINKNIIIKCIILLFEFFFEIDWKYYLPNIGFKSKKPHLKTLNRIYSSLSTSICYLP